MSHTGRRVAAKWFEMTNLWKQIEHERIKPALRRLRPYRIATYSGVNVSYKGHLDGGGSTFGQEFIPVLRARGMPTQKRAFEWCSGPGFIGFSLLAHGLCETLCLADVNPEAVAACRRTVSRNALDERVAVYQSDNLTDISALERWDLVVSNPPHFDDRSPGQLRYHDPEWSIHRGFFAAVGRHLNPGGVIVLQENNIGSTAETFAAMIAQAGLKTVFVQACAPQRTTRDRFYYIAIMRASDQPPAWARD
jgi:16S rRNA G1207 methylase RsmC